MPVRSTSALDGDGGEIVGPDADEFSLVGEMERRAGITCDDGPGHDRLPVLAVYMMVIILHRTRGVPD